MWRPPTMFCLWLEGGMRSGSTFFSLWMGYTFAAKHICACVHKHCAHDTQHEHLERGHGSCCPLLSLHCVCVTCDVSCVMCCTQYGFRVQNACTTTATTSFSNVFSISLSLCFMCVSMVFLCVCVRTDACSGGLEAESKHVLCLYHHRVFSFLLVRTELCVLLEGEKAGEEKGFWICEKCFRGGRCVHAHVHACACVHTDPCLLADFLLYL